MKLNPQDLAKIADRTLEHYNRNAEDFPGAPALSMARRDLHGRPRFARHSLHDVEQVTIAAIHPDFW